MANVIRLDDDTANHNASLLHQVSDELPSANVVTQVNGNRTEDAPEAYTKLVEAATSGLAQNVNTVRNFVAKYADALQKAVIALRQADDLSASDADSIVSLITDVRNGTSLATAPTTSADSTVASSAASAASRTGLGG